MKKTNDKTLQKTATEKAKSGLLIVNSTDSESNKASGAAVFQHKAMPLGTGKGKDTEDHKAPNLSGSFKNPVAKKSDDSFGLWALIVTSDVNAATLDLI